jgi:hypothetical protein
VDTSSPKFQHRGVITSNYFIGIARGSSNLLPAIITWAIDILIFMMVVSILLIDKKNRHIYLDLFVEVSDLVVSSHGVVSYSKDTERVT